MKLVQVDLTGKQPFAVSLNKAGNMNISSSFIKENHLEGKKVAFFVNEDTDEQRKTLQTKPFLYLGEVENGGFLLKKNKTGSCQVSSKIIADKFQVKKLVRFRLLRKITHEAKPYFCLEAI